MATMGGDVTKEISSEVDLFGSIMQQNIIENEFNREYASLATIQHGAPIKFMVKRTNDLYLELNYTGLHVLAKITNADDSNIGANTAGQINLKLHSMFREISVVFYNRNVSDTNPLYPYRNYLETLLNFNKETLNTRLQWEGWTNDSLKNISVTEVAGVNAGLTTSAVTFSTSVVVELVGRPHLYVIHQDRLISPGINHHMKFIPAADSFVCKSAAPGAGAAQQNYKMIIQQVDLIIHTKQLTSTVQKAHMSSSKFTICGRMIHASMSSIFQSTRTKPRSASIKFLPAPYRTWSLLVL